MEKNHEVVRMILWDYDAAPDGCGTYVKLDAKFDSLDKALRYRDMHLHGMYWGRIEKLDGTIIQRLDEVSELCRETDETDFGYDWDEHEAKCDGCSLCNRGGFPNDDED